MIDIADRRELFVDHFLIEKLDGCALRLHRPTSGGPVFHFDQPWEGIGSNYVTVIQDGEMYRLYYRGRPADPIGQPTSDGTTLECTCCAESHDGIHWTRPELGLYEVMGTRRNNVVYAGDPPYSHNFCPFLDTRPGVPSDQRYKAVAGFCANMVAFRLFGLDRRRAGLFGFVSPDGLRWKKVQQDPIFDDGTRTFDSQNVAFWSQSEGRYVLYYRQHVDANTSQPVRDEVRYMPHHIKTVARATSDDFIHWSTGKLMDFSGHPPTLGAHVYTNATTPYFRAPHIYLSLAARFTEKRQALPAAVVERLGREDAAILAEDGRQPHAGFELDCSDTVLMSSRGGESYQRTFLESFIRPGLDPRNWTTRSNFAALGIVPTGESEISMYVLRHFNQPSCFLERMTLRTDGFVSISAPYAGGQVITRPFTFAGRRLSINCATSAAGVVRVELQDAHGHPLPRFTVADCAEIVGDQIERCVTWRSGGDLSAFAGKPLRLRFELTDADLYSMRIHG